MLSRFSFLSRMPSVGALALIGASALFAANAQAQQYAPAAPSSSVGALSGVPTNPPGAGDEQPKTRAQVRAELARLRQAGYDPQQWWNYPENLQEAQKRVQIENAGGVYTAPSMPVRHSSGL